MHGILSALSLAALVAFGSAGGVLATEPPIRLGITPVDYEGTYFDLTLRPGQRQTLSVELANFGTEPVEARTYLADVYTIVNGGLGAELHDEPVSGPTRWVDYPTEVLALPAGRGAIRHFAVELPEEVTPGEYITSLAIENAEPIEGSGSVAINQVNRTVIAIAITVPGPRRPALEIGGVGHELVSGVSVVSFRLINPGNVHLHPAGTFTLQANDGRLISRAPVEMGTFFAGTEAIVEMPLAEALQAGAYCASVSLHDAEQGVEATAKCLPFRVETAIASSPRPGAGFDQPDAPSSLSGLPWWVPVAGAALLAAVVILGGATRARRPASRGIR